MEGDIINSKSVFSGKFINVHLDEARFPDGRKYEKESVDTLNSVRVVPIIQDNNAKEDKIILIDQYIIGSNEYRLGLPGGCIDFIDNPKKYTETPQQAALRELFEETGYKAKNMDLLYYRQRRGTIMSDTCYYLATGLYKSDDKRHIDENEPKRCCENDL